MTLEEINDKVRDFCCALDTEIDIACYVKDWEAIRSFDDLYEALENDAFYSAGEVIYYSNAMKYLTENDTSLRESLALAEEQGYTLDKLNSETLATLLKSQNIRDEFEELRREVDDFFDDLEEPDEEEDEDDEDYDEDEEDTNED